MVRTILLIVSASILMAPHGAWGESLKARSIGVTEVEPSASEIKRAKQYKVNAKKAGKPRVWAVKIPIELPPPRARLLRLYIGEIEIQEYGSYDEGIFFHIYYQNLLDSLWGKPVRIGYDGATPTYTGVDFPVKTELSKTQEQCKLPTTREFLKEKNQ